MAGAAGVELVSALPNRPPDELPAACPRLPNGFGLDAPCVGGVAAGVVVERLLNSFGPEPAGVVDPNSDGAAAGVEEVAVAAEAAPLEVDAGWPKENPPNGVDAVAVDAPPNRLVPLDAAGCDDALPNIDGAFGFAVPNKLGAPAPVAGGKLNGLFF